MISADMSVFASQLVNELIENAANEELTGILAVCCCAISAHAEADGSSSSQLQPSNDLQVAQNSPASSTSPAPPAPREHRSAATAAVLSIFIPGAGNFYTGQAKKGALVLGTAFAGAALMASTTCDYTCSNGEYARGFGGMGIVIGASIYGLVSSIHRAEDINSGKVAALEHLRFSFPKGRKSGVQIAYKFAF
jgi:TM2 domain-containing membrane protein YozV